MRRRARAHGAVLACGAGEGGRVKAWRASEAVQPCKAPPPHPTPPWDKSGVLTSILGRVCTALSVERVCHVVLPLQPALPERVVPSYKKQGRGADQYSNYEAQTQARDLTMWTWGSSESRTCVKAPADRKRTKHPRVARAVRVLLCVLEAGVAALLRRRFPVADAKNYRVAARVRVRLLHALRRGRGARTVGKAVANLSKHRPRWVGRALEGKAERARNRLEPVAYAQATWVRVGSEPSRHWRTHNGGAEWGALKTVPSRVRRTRRRRSSGPCGAHCTQQGGRPQPQRGLVKGAAAFWLDCFTRSFVVCVGPTAMLRVD